MEFWCWRLECIWQGPSPVEFARPPLPRSRQLLEWLCRASPGNAVLAGSTRDWEPCGITCSPAGMGVLHPTLSIAWDRQALLKHRVQHSSVEMANPLKVKHCKNRWPCCRALARALGNVFSMGFPARSGGTAPRALCQPPTGPTAPSRRGEVLSWGRQEHLKSKSLLESVRKTLKRLSSRTGDSVLQHKQLENTSH